MDRQDHFANKNASLSPDPNTAGRIPLKIMEPFKADRLEVLIMPAVVSSR